MKHNTFTPFLCGLLALPLLQGCGSDLDPTQATPTEQAASVKEELTQNVVTNFTYNYNKFDQLSPNRSERILAALTNRLTASPTYYGLQVDTKSGPMPIEPKPFRHYIPAAKNSLLWWANHKREFACKCDIDQNDGTRYDKVACTKLAIVNGILTTMGPRLSCNDKANSPEKDVERSAEFRSNYFGRGPISVPGGDLLVQRYNNAFPFSPRKEQHSVDGNFGSLFYGLYVPGLVIQSAINEPSAISFLYSWLPTYSLPTAPTDGTLSCITPRTACSYYGGTCKSLEGKEFCVPKDGETYCQGVCDGGELNKAPCVLKNSEDADYCTTESGKATHVYGFGGNSAPVDLPLPILQDGIALQIPDPGSVSIGEMKNHLFEKTPDGKLEYSINYYDITGPPKSLKVVIDGIATDLTPWADQDPAPNRTDPSNNKYFGDIYKKHIDAGTDRCSKYYFVAETATGKIVTFPEYGSLAVPIKSGKVDFAKISDLIEPEPSKCNSYYPSERAGVTALPAPTTPQCNTGEKRSCFSGSDSSFVNEKSACKAGTEECVNGYWSGVCSDEVLSKGYEICGDDIDNNCDGYIDEGCPKKPAPAPTNPTTPTNPSPSQGQSGGSGSNSNSNSSNATTTKKSGCSSTDGSPAEGSLLLLLLGFLGLSVRRRATPNQD